MSNIKKIIISALNSHKGDNLARARNAWGGLSDIEMDQLHGQSGRTKREFLNDYQQHDDEVNEAINWVNNN
jgi:hypothetical protein